MGLLEKVKNEEIKRNSIEEGHIQVALAWMGGEVTPSQIARALHIPNPSVYSKLLMWIREAYRQGKITIKAD